MGAKHSVGFLVHAELAAHFQTIGSLFQFLAKLEISLDPFSEELTLKTRRNNYQAEIGGFYRNYFTQLKIIESTAGF
jgi:hypothetical protein